MCWQKRIASLTLAAMVVAEAAGTALAAGYWNMPGTIFQRTGHGYGGGYHAPFILGPIRLDGWCGPNEVRWPCPPGSSCGDGTYGCGGRMVEAPSKLEGVVATPPMQPAVGTKPVVLPAEMGGTIVAAPQAAPWRPLFDSPVQP
jgi:hypothetical protein